MDTRKIGEDIRDKRLFNGWTQEEFAEKLDVSAKTVSTWESGKFTSIKNDNLDKLKELLHVSIGEIFVGEDMTGLAEDTKALLDQEIKSLNERVNSVQTITIKVEDRGLLSLEIGIYSYGFSIVAIALAFWAASSRTLLISLACFVFGFFGVGFAIFGKRIVNKLTMRIQRERDQEGQQ